MGILLKQTDVDEYGLLVDAHKWTPALANEMASETGIDQLTDQHWSYIATLRGYYQQFNVPPPPSKVCHQLHLRPGCGHELFSSCLNAWRIAGLPDPGEEAKSYLSAV